MKVNGRPNPFLVGSFASSQAGRLMAGGLLIGICLFAAPVRGADPNTCWIVSSGDWSDANNWSAGRPNWASMASISNGGTATINRTGEVCASLKLGEGVGESGSLILLGDAPRVGPFLPLPPYYGQLNSGNEYVGYSGTGMFTHTGGYNTSSTELHIGYNAGSSGTYQLGGSGVLRAGDVYVGKAGTGSFIQTGGDSRIGSLAVANEPGSSGTYQLIGRGRLSTSSEVVGRGGTGTFIQTDGDNNITNELWLGLDPGSSGTYQLSGSGLLSALYVYVGKAGTGSFIQTGGNSSVTQQLFVGFDPGSLGTYQLGGTGHLTAVQEYIGYKGNATFTQTGGNNNAGILVMFGPCAAYTLSGSGQLTAQVTWILDPNHVFQQTGGSHKVDRLSIGGIYEISGGSLAVTRYLLIGKRGVFCITGPSAVIEITATTSASGWLQFSPGACFSAEPGSRIHMIDAFLDNQGTDANALSGLANLTLIFEAGDVNVDSLEVSGRDLGATPDGFVNNFGLWALELGSSEGPGRVCLVDAWDNQPAFTGTEALYVQGLIVNPGSELWLNGIHLYVNGVMVNPGDGALYGGGSIYVPDPATILILAAGGLALIRPRRAQAWAGVRIGWRWRRPISSRCLNHTLLCLPHTSPGRDPHGVKG